MLGTYAIPISVKGIIIENKKIWLRKNERNDWELPGGKLEEGEQPQVTLKRELKEEVGFEVEVTEIIQAYLYKIHHSLDETKGVLVLTYACKLLKKTKNLEVIGEGGKAEFEKFSKEDIKNLSIPQFYKQSIEKEFNS